MEYRWILFVVAVSLLRVCTEADTRAVLDAIERIANVGIDASTALPDYHSVVVHLLNGTEPSDVDVKQFRKRPPTLQYRMLLGNETFMISLKRNTHMISSGCIIRHVNGSGHSTVTPCVEHDLTCYYTGTTSVNSESWVATSVCGGLKGLLTFGNTSLFIYPLKKTSEQTPSSPNHMIYRYQGDKHVCKTEDDIAKILYPTSQARQRRQINDMKTRYIEAGIVVDPPMARYHNDNIFQYVFTGFNIASKLFADESIGTSIKLLMSEIVVFTTSIGFDVSDTVDADKTMNSFCEWQRKHHTLKKTDVSVLLTRNDIEYGHSEDRKSANGLAFPSGACKIRKKCAVVEDTGPVFGLTLAHEIGHLLGMGHDNTRDNHCNPTLMSAYGNIGIDAFRWSECSAHELKNNLYNLACLKNGPSVSVDGNMTHLHGSQLVTLPLPGMVYTADDQCRLMLGDNAYFLFIPGHDPCKEIACHTDLGNYYYSQPLMDGTDCNNTRMWCMRGECVPMNASLQTDPSSGGWSPWVSAMCSDTCGGGLLIEKRTCTDPRPRYGGKICVGPSTKYRLCNMQKCPGYTSLNMTCDMSNINSTYGCNNTCNDPNTMKGNTYKTCFYLDLMPFKACVDQQCQQFGCDGVHGSRVQYDACGECGGNNTTCLKKAYTFSGTVHSYLNGYRAVASIPIHSTAVRVEQNNTDMVLGITVNNEVIFDGENFIKQTLVISRDIPILYRPSPELIEIGGPLRDNFVIQARVRKDIQMRGSSEFAVVSVYHMAFPQDIPRYTWGERTSQCSITCGGGQTIQKTYQCFDISGNTVEDYRCDISTKPNDELSTCYTPPCPVRWVASEWGFCSGRCGQGIKVRNVSCMQLADGQDQVLSDDRCLGFTRPDSNIMCDLNPCGVWRKIRVSQCSKTCSEGIQRAKYKCFENSSSDKLVDESLCPDLALIDIIEVCNHGPCVIDPYTTSPPPRDLDERCGQYIANSQVIDLCVLEQYRAWGEKNCRATCLPCIGAVDRQHEPPCEMYDRKYCLDPIYRQYMSTHCGRYCCPCHIDGSLCRS